MSNGLLLENLWDNVGMSRSHCRIQDRMDEKNGVDAAVIGAGLSGLAAARVLVRAGREVAVLEARDRVGGRVLDEPLGGGSVIELGGQWIGPGQPRSYGHL